MTQAQRAQPVARKAAQQRPRRAAVRRAEPRRQGEARQRRKRVHLEKDEWLCTRRAGDNPRGDFIRDTRDIQATPTKEAIGRDRVNLRLLQACQEARIEEEKLLRQYRLELALDEGEGKAKSSVPGRPPLCVTSLAALIPRWLAPRCRRCRFALIAHATGSSSSSRCRKGISRPTWPAAFTRWATLSRQVPQARPRPAVVLRLERYDHLCFFPAFGQVVTLALAWLREYCRGLLRRKDAARR